jgi:hypothetical protein
VMEAPTSGDANSPPTSLSSTTTSNNDDEEEEEACAWSTYYCWVYFESEKSGKDLRVLFAMSKGHDGLNFLKHTDPPLWKQTNRFFKLRLNTDSTWTYHKARSQNCQLGQSQHAWNSYQKTGLQATMNSKTKCSISSQSSLNTSHMSEQLFCWRNNKQKASILLKSGAIKILFYNCTTY